MAEVQDKTINALDEATIINSEDITPIVQAVGSNYVTKKAELGDIGDHIATDMTFPGLQTTSKNLVGAINEASQNGGASEITELDDVNINSSTLANGDALVYDSTSSKWVNGEVTPGAVDLSDLGDVAISSPSNDQVLKYNDTSGKWENGAGGGGGASSLDDLSDVDISSPTADQVLKYDSDSGKWVNGTGGGVSSLDDLTDVDITTPSANQVLKYNDVSGKWENTAESTGVSDLDDLTDVSISSPTDGQVLTYDSNSSTWVNRSGGSGSGGHTIVDSAGTDLAQRANLQFKGAYSEDNSTDDTTEVNVIRNMTKAEFDLLSDDEKVGIINVTDITGNSENEFQPVVYSTDEREIGVWADGRPLYQKTISMGTLPNMTTKAVEHGISNIDVTAIVSLMAMASNGTYAMFPRIHDSQVNAQIFFEVNSTYITCYGRGQDQSGWTSCYVTIQYCKTTDTAGSGTWTPQGVPAVHYSTDEQVVGTWIDGSTIYEKSFSFNTTTFPTGWNWFSLNFTCDSVVTAEVNVKDSITPYLYTQMPICVDNGNGKIGIYNNLGGNLGTTSGYIIIRYTKVST